MVPTRHSFEHDGHRLAYDEYGAGERAVVLMPGLLFSRKMHGPLATTLATLDFGDGRMGLYDFTDNQWWNPLRARRIVVRGTRGEIVDERVTRLVDPWTPVESSLVRRQAGLDLNLEGVDITREDLDTILTIDVDRWRQEIGHREEHLSKFGGLPEEIWEAHRRIDAALRDAD